MRGVFDKDYANAKYIRQPTKTNPPMILFGFFFSFPVFMILGVFLSLCYSPPIQCIKQRNSYPVYAIDK